MALDLKSYEQGVRDYWREIGCRSREVQKRESIFAELAHKFANRKPAHFTREDLVLILNGNTRMPVGGTEPWTA